MGKSQLKKRFDITSIDRLIEDGVWYLSQLSLLDVAQAGTRPKVVGQNVSCTEALSSSVKKKGFFTALLSGESSINDRSGADIIDATADLKNLSFSQLITLFLKISLSSRTKSTEAACDQAHVSFRQSTERLLYEQLVSQIQLAHQSAMNAGPNGSDFTLNLPPFAGTRSQTQSRLRDEQAAVAALIRNNQCGEVGKQILLTLGLIKKLRGMSSKSVTAEVIDEWEAVYPWRVPLGTSHGNAHCNTSEPTTPVTTHALPFNTSPPKGGSRKPRSRAAMGRLEEIFLEIPSLCITLKLRTTSGGKYTDIVYTHVIEPGLRETQQTRVEIWSYVGGVFKHFDATATAGRCINELKRVLSRSGGGGGPPILKSVSSTRSSQSHCSGVSEVLVQARANLKKPRQSDQENIHPPATTLSPPQDARARTPSEIRLAIEAKSSSLKSQTLPQRRPFNKRFITRKSSDGSFSGSCNRPEKSAISSSPTSRAETERTKRATQTIMPTRMTCCNYFGRPTNQKRKLTNELGMITPSQRLPTITSVAGGLSKLPTSRVISQADTNQLSAQLTSTVDCPELVNMATNEFSGRFQTALTSVPTSYRTLTTSNNSGIAMSPELHVAIPQSREFSPPSFCLSRIGSQELQKNDAQQTGDMIRRSDVYVVKRRDF